MLLGKLTVIIVLFLTLTAIIFLPANMVAAQNATSQPIYLPTSQLTFVGQQGTPQLSRTLVVVGLTNQSVSVTLVPTDLYDNTSGNSIPASSISILPQSPFSLQQTSQNVNVTINTLNSSVSTYQGAIALYATNATATIATVTIPVTVIIEPSTSSINQTQIFLPTTQINLIGQQGIPRLSRTILAVGYMNQTVKVTLAPTDLYDSSDGNSIPAASVQITPASPFNLSQFQQQSITISINTANTSLGTYQGTIILTSTNATATTATNIPVTVSIEPLYSSLAQQQVYLSTNQLNFVGDLYSKNLDNTLIVVGVTNQNVSVKLIPTDLYNNITGKSIPASSITLSNSSFSITQSNETVNISIDTSSIGLTTLQPQIFQGALILITTNATATTTTAIPIMVKLELPGLFSSQWAYFIVMVILIGFSVGFGTLDFPYQKSNLINKIRKYEKVFVVVSGFFAIAIYFLLILSNSLTDPGNLIDTAAIIPLATYLTTYVKDRRDDSKSLQTAANTLRNQNIEKDLSTIDGLMGELTTHKASFTSHIHANGTLSSDVWKKQRKEGAASDFPLLRLEKYYTYIPLYNYNYSLAVDPTEYETAKVKIAEKLKAKIFDGIKNKFDSFKDFDDFKNKFYRFKETYSELETLLFTNLEYDRGALTKFELSPLEMEYPKITKPLLLALFNADTINPSKISDFKLYDDKTRKLIELTKDNVGEQFEALSYNQLMMINKGIYEGENTKKFLAYIDHQFNKRYDELMRLADGLVNPPKETQKPDGSDQDQIKGTFTIDAKGVKNALGANAQADDKDGADAKANDKEN